MRFFIFIFLSMIFTSHVSQSQENTTSHTVTHAGDMEIFIKNLNRKWNEFFIPSKKCHENYLTTHNNYDLNHFIKCKNIARKQKEIFDNAHKKEVYLISKYKKQTKENERQAEIYLWDQLLSEKNGITVIINNYEKLWQEFYIPSKKCTKKHSKHYNYKKCNNLKIEKRHEFSVRHKKTTELIQSYENKEQPLKLKARYIAFMNGGSACPDIKYWEKFSDNIDNGIYETKEFDKHCFYLRKNSIVYGFLDRVTYKSSEYVQVKSSDGKSLWLELTGVEEIISSTTQKPKQWSTNLRTQSGILINNRVSNSPKVNKSYKMNSVTYGVRTKGGGIACLSENWYKEATSRIDLNFLDYYLKSKKCLILKKDMPITLLDTTIFTRRSVFLFQGVKFWSSMENIVMD